MQEGRIIGREEGLKEGKNETLKNIVANLKSSGVSVDFIMNITGLTIEESDSFS